MGTSANEGPSLRLSDRRVVIALSTLLWAAVGGLAWQLVPRTTGGTAPATAAPAASTPRPPALNSGAGAAPGTTASTLSPAPETAPHVDLTRLPASTAAARQLVQGLWDRRGATAAMSEEEKKRWLENWQHLLEAGESALPALAEYLRSDQDTFFTDADSGPLGFRSAREAVIDALAILGGDAATAVMADALAMTASPREVALLASALEKNAPDAYRNEWMQAVRESLEMASSRQLGSLDVAPLFAVLQRYGGPEAVTDLERAAGRWGPYATIALATLPEDAGVPTLLQMADPPHGSRPHTARLQALQAVAQLAGTNDAARQTLVEQARSNRIPPNLWPYLTRPLAGQQAHFLNPVLEERPAPTSDPRISTVHLAGTNQNLYWARPDEGLSADQMARRTTLIAELRAATDSPEAHRVLDQSEALLGQP
jgi:hypothetical protein